MAKTQKALVSERALMARINRKLPEFEQLKICREDSRWFSNCGRYYIVDHNRNMIDAMHVDIEALGRELGVLAGHEQLAED